MYIEKNGRQKNRMKYQKYFNIVSFLFDNHKSDNKNNTHRLAATACRYSTESLDIEPSNGLKNPDRQNPKITRIENV